MSIWRRAIIYLKRNIKRTTILLFILTGISSALVISISIYKGSEESIDELRKTYGNSFIVEIGFHPGNMEESDLWESHVAENGAIEWEYKGPILNDETINRILTVPGITSVCKEKDGVMHVENMEFLPGLFHNCLKLYYEDPEGWEGTEEVHLENLGRNCLRGYSRSDLSSYFRTNGYELISGRHFTEEDKDKVLISDVMARNNNLNVGDSIYVESPMHYDQMGMDHYTYENSLEIVGIFHVNVNQVTNEYTPEEDIAQNYIFVTLETVRESDEKHREILAPGSVFQYLTATFFIENPKEMDQIIEKVQNMDEDWWAFEIYPDDSAYQSALTPLEVVEKIAVFMMIFTIVSCVILLGLVLKIWMKSRKTEIGILISLGKQKQEIIGQLLLENFMVLFVAILLTVALSTGVSNAIGKQVLSSVNTQIERRDEAREKMNNTIPTDATKVTAYSAQFEVKSKVAVPEVIVCEVTVEIVEIVFGIVWVVMVITTYYAARKMLKLKLLE